MQKKKKNRKKRGTKQGGRQREERIVLLYFPLLPSTLGDEVEKPYLTFCGGREHKTANFFLFFFFFSFPEPPYSLNSTPEEFASI